MKTWQDDIHESLQDFSQVSALAGTLIQEKDWQVTFQPAPHVAPSLPRGHMAVYGFWGDGEWLKIGIAGSKSGARFTSQHYKIGKAKSSLALSLSRNERMALLPDFALDDPGVWIRGCCHRVNILLPESYGRPMLALLEAFLHVRLRPRHER